MLWRKAVAKAAGMPPLEHMFGFYDPNEDKRVLTDYKPIPWESLTPRPLHLLLNHSDCDGMLRWEDCAAIADDLESIIDDLDAKGPFCDREKAANWIRGLRAAAKAKEDVNFH